MWNAWRRKYPDVRPDLSEADLTGWTSSGQYSARQSFVGQISSGQTLSAHCLGRLKNAQGTVAAPAGGVAVAFEVLGAKQVHNPRNVEDGLVDFDRDALGGQTALGEQADDRQRALDFGCPLQGVFQVWQLIEQPDAVAAVGVDRRWPAVSCQPGPAVLGALVCLGVLGV